MNKTNNIFQINKEKSDLWEPPSCYDDIVRSIACMNNKSYELFYSNRWYFKFENQPDFALVDRIKTFKPNKDLNTYYKKLLDLQGYSFEIIEIERFKQSAFEIIARCNYIVVFVDGYWLPWDAYYQKIHNTHAIVILNVTEDKNFICCDLYHNLYKIELSNTKLFSGLQQILHPIFNSKKIDPIYRLQYFKSIINDIDINMFNDIHNLSNCIYMGQNIKDLFLSIHTIAWTRWTFGIYLSSLKELEPSFEYYEDKMKKIALKWNNIKLCLIKHEYFVNNKKRLDSLINYTCNLLHEVADNEYLLYTQIVNNETLTIEGIDNNSYIGKNICTININQFLNNMGISNTINIDDKSDLTGTGEYIVIDDINDSLIKIGNGREYDNISCNGQIINVYNCYMDKLIIFGCCEWGNYNGNIIINEMSSPIVLSVNISDFSSTPIFNEELYANGCAYTYNNELHKTWDQISIYKVILPVRSAVYTIRLPICPNMHIMALQYTF